MKLSPNEQLLTIAFVAIGFCAGWVFTQCFWIRKLKQEGRKSLLED